MCSVDKMTNFYAEASWVSFIQALTYDKPSMFLFKPREALAIIYDSYDLTFQMRSYMLNNALISWERSYNTSKKLLNEEIQKVKIT